jgi:hypothetical protein
VLFVLQGMSMCAEKKNINLVSTVFTIMKMNNTTKLVACQMVPETYHVQDLYLYGKSMR